MNIFSFGVHFTDEKSCRLYFKEQRDREGVVCNRCQGREHYWLQNKWSYQCKSCNSRTSLRSGTKLHKRIENDRKIREKEVLIKERQQLLFKKKQKILNSSFQIPKILFLPILSEAIFCQLKSIRKVHHLPLRHT